MFGVRTEISHIQTGSCKMQNFLILTAVCDISHDANCGVRVSLRLMDMQPVCKTVELSFNLNDVPRIHSRWINDLISD